MYTSPTWQLTLHGWADWRLQYIKRYVALICMYSYVQLCEVVHWGSDICYFHGMVMMMTFIFPINFPLNLGPWCVKQIFLPLGCLWHCCIFTWSFGHLQGTSLTVIITISAQHPILFIVSTHAFPVHWLFMLSLGHIVIAVSEGTKVALMAIRPNATNKLCHARGSSPSALTAWLSAPTLDLYIWKWQKPPGTK